jgi:hypothetical protein
MHPARTRQIKGIGIAAAAAALALGTAAPAWADPGNGNGSGAGGGSNAPAQPPGQEKKADPTPAATATTAATPPVPTPTDTQTPPGQAKKPTAPPTGKGNNNAGGNSNATGNGNGKATAPGQVKKAAGGNSHGNGGGNGNGGGKGKGANGPSGHNPPGNNGTVKIHALPGDPGHHNVPHPGCSFVVDFWGFDAGQTLNVSFTGQAPTGAGTPLTLSGSGTSVTSPDDAGGGNDPDGELVFTPTASQLSVLGEPSAQGYHVKLDVATGEPGGHKYKVFWISPCTQDTVDEAPTPTETPTLTTDTPTTKTPTLTANSGTLTAVRNTPIFSVPELDTSTAQVTDSSPELQRDVPAVTSLPFRGANVNDLVLGGAMTLLLGVVLTFLARRQRHRIG